MTCELLLDSTIVGPFSFRAIRPTFNILLLSKRTNKPKQDSMNSITIRSLFLVLSLARIAAGNLVTNETWPVSCGMDIARDADGTPCDSFCGVEGTASVAGPHRSVIDNEKTGIQYQVCACDASVGLSANESVTVNFRKESEEACKYDELELTLPNRTDVSCSEVGLEGFNATRCNEYCNEVVFKDFVALDLDVDSGYKGDATGGCRCFWGEASVIACTPIGATSTATSGAEAFPFVGFLTIAGILSATAYAIGMAV